MAQGSSNPSTNLKEIAGAAVAVNIGNADNGSLRVVLASDQPEINVSGTVNANLGTTDSTNLSDIKTAIQLLDNAISGNEMQVDVVTIPAPLNTTGAGTGTSALRVHLSNESLEALENISVTIPGTVELGTVSLNSLETIAVTQSGTWNLNNISGAISLPTGAATSSNQSTIIGHVDGIENLLGTIDADTGNIATSVQLIDDAIIANNTAIGSTKLMMFGGFDGTNSRYISTTSSGHVNVSDGGNTLTVDGSVSVTQNIAADLKATVVQSLGSAATRWYTQISDGSNSPSIKASSTAAVASDTSLVVSISPNNSVVIGSGTNSIGTVGLNAGTNAIGKLVANDGVDIGDVTINNASIAVTGTFWQATQPVSGTVTANTGLTQPLTDAQLRATAVPVSGTFWQTTQPVSLASLPTLAAGTNNIGDVDVLSIVPGTAATNLGKAEDAAHATGDVGVMALAVRTATPANRSGTDGDYEPLQVNAGRLWTSAVIDTALPAGANNIGDVDVLSLPAIPTGTNSIGTVGLNAGTNAIGKLVANDGVDIGDVTINNASIAVTGTFWQATQPVSGTVSITSNSSVNISQIGGVSTATGAGTSSTGTQRVVEASASTGAITSVAGTTTASTSLKASNTSRRGLTVYNDSTAILYVSLGSTCTTTSFTVKLQPDDYYEVPFYYNGAVTGVWASATGNARITEIT